MKTLNEAYDSIKSANNGDSSSYIQNFSGSDYLQIYMNAKILLAYANSETSESMSNVCYKCRHRGNVTGTTNSCCRNLLAFAIGKRHGNYHGRFYHPINFDPYWLKYCDGFEPEAN